MNAHHPVLQVENLHVRIGRAAVLNGVGFDVGPGQAVGLVGETGCGKSMTVRAVAGLLGRIGGVVTNGSIRLNGQDMTRATAKEWRAHQGRTVTVVPQASLSSLDPLRQVRREMAETIRHHDRRANVAAQTAKLLEAVHLEPSQELLCSYPHELSGGMRQRVMIALALATRPKLLIADEPTTALDASIRRSVLDLLTELRRDVGLGLLLVSHDIGAIAAATGQVVVMYAGVAVECGPTAEVLAAPAHPYTRALLASLPERTAPGRPLPVIEGQPPEPTWLTSGCRFAPRCPVATASCSDAPPEPCRLGPVRAAACHAPATDPTAVGAAVLETAS
ncbi:MAG: ABC transporter ATP-binding protein [Bifidobacteriaceae bacterium]|jgi:oligopeptide/dipeptide ABC transporter ATP-binding protein|nr:ABC transporter ATP-binding protein [Bifidobacteriaceae bacterium]